MNNEINRGELARQLLSNPIYKEALVATKADLMNQWASTKWFQVRKREAYWRMYRAVESVESHVKHVLDTGEMARQQEANKQKLKNVI